MKRSFTGFEPPATPYQPDLRLLPNEQSTDFGAIVTRGAVRLVSQGARLLCIPLPEGEDFDVALRPGRLLGRPFRASSLVAVDAQGTRGRNLSFVAEGETVRFTVSGSEFGCELGGD